MLLLIVEIAGNKKPQDRSLEVLIFGRGGGIRTHDPLLPKQMRYRAALRPESLSHCCEEVRIITELVPLVNCFC
jgi:hypothetical protein